jgi:hypothetical protein
MGGVKSSTINFPTVADLDHPDCEFIILDRIDNAVISLTNAVFFLPGKFFAANWTGIVGKPADPIDDPLKIAPWNSFKILPDGITEKNIIGGHWP